MSRLGSFSPAPPSGSGPLSPEAGDAGERGGPGHPASLPHVALRPVLLIAVAVLALEMSVSARYGLHRDELYFIACGRHLAWGYVDQPPLVPATARLVTAIFGASPVALRTLPALGLSAATILSALMARELGGGRTAQVLAALAAATSPQLLAANHLLSPTAFDVFFWALITFLALQLARTSDTRLWLAIGAVGGVALEGKLNAGFLLVAIVIGFLIGGRRRLLDRWFVGGAVLAAILFAPDVAWNATHDWAQITMLRSLHDENSTLGASLIFIPAQIVVVGPVLVVFWVGGLRRLFRHESGRPLAVAYLVLLAWFTLTGAKSYYLAGMYFVLFAGGGLAVEERLASHLAAKGLSFRGWVRLMLLGGLLSLPLTLPILPLSTLASGSWESNINKDLSATVGWPQFVHQVSEVADRLPPVERARLVVYTGDYGAAGAIDLYGAHYGLPEAISGHNNLWWWGPGAAPDDSTTIAVNLPRSYLLTIFADVVPAGTVTTPHGVWTEERGDPIWICTHQIEAWQRAWPDARHYG